LRSVLLGSEQTRFVDFQLKHDDATRNAVATIAQLNASPHVADHELAQLELGKRDGYSHKRLPELQTFVALLIRQQVQTAFPDAPASLAVVLRWHLRGLNLDLAVRKAPAFRADRSA
jgi:hypothetical protein